MEIHHWQSFSPAKSINEFIVMTRGGLESIIHILLNDRVLPHNFYGVMKITILLFGTKLCWRKSIAFLLGYLRTPHSTMTTLWSLAEWHKSDEKAKWEYSHWIMMIRKNGKREKQRPATAVKLNAKVTHVGIFRTTISINFLGNTEIHLSKAATMTSKTHNIASQWRSLHWTCSTMSWLFLVWQKLTIMATK